MTGRILVTGASGFAGSHLLDQLVGTSEVVAWTRGVPPDVHGRAVRWHRVDLLDRQSVRESVRRVQPDVVYHLAGSPHVAASWSETAVPLAHNVLGTHHLLESLSGLRRPCRVLITGSATVYASSASAITEDHPLAPVSPYAFSKFAQERLGLLAIDEDGLDVVVTRSFNHTGPRQTPAFVAPSIARQIARIEAGLDSELKVGNLDAIRDFTDVRDVVRAYVALVRKAEAGSVFNVASGIGRPMRTVLDALVARARVPVNVQLDPARMRPHDTPVVVGDASRLRSTTGWEPSVGFEKMLDDLLSYWRERIATER